MPSGNGERVWALIYHAASRRKLTARIGEGTVHIVTRVMGIILAALTVQFILNGITAYYGSLMNHKRNTNKSFMKALL
jgi:multiple antibiotic resistance protein